jgi:hypothetical protein
MLSSSKPRTRKTDATLLELVMYKATDDYVYKYVT